LWSRSPATPQLGIPHLCRLNECQPPVEAVNLCAIEAINLHVNNNNKNNNNNNNNNKDHKKSQKKKNQFSQQRGFEPHMTTMPTTITVRNELA